MSRTRWSIVAGLVFILTACKESGTGPPPPPPPPPPPAPTQLVFLNQPDTTESQAQITPALRVAVQDASGSLVNEAARDVTIRIAANPTGATLSGTTTVRAVAGIATFSDLSLDHAGDGFILQALSTALPPVTSNLFSIRLTFTSSATGYSHSCGVNAAGYAFCWGANGGALGDSTFVNRWVITPVRGRHQFTQLSAGIGHTCGVTSTTAYCWGDGSQGQLGDGSTFGSIVPVPVAGTFSQITAGSAHTCAVTATFAAYCWGTNSFFELGTGPGTPGTTRPVLVAGGHEFVQISAGDHHTCAVDTAHQVFCWGDNVYGQLGDSSQQPRSVPTAVGGGGGVRFEQVSAAWSYTCGVSIEHKLYCWGLGPPNTGAYSLIPAEVPGGVLAVQVSSGYRHACAVSTDSLAYCWGENAAGGVGDSTNAPVGMPKLVVGGLHFVRVSVGSEHTCGVTTDHALYCWGRNYFGAVGDGTTTDRYAPVRVIQVLTP